MRHFKFVALLVAFWTPASVCVAAFSVNLDFASPVAGTISDNNGLGTGFTTRLPGTGSAIPTNDPNMDLVSSPGKLLLTSTHADFNQSPGPTGNNLPNLEAPGVFVTGVGAQDIFVSAIFRNVQVPNGNDQLKVYAGVNENKVLHAGVHELNVYMFSENTGSGDVNTITGFNAFTTGDDIEITLSRQAGLWSLSWNNLTASTSGALPAVAVPWLDAEPDLYFGIYAANAGTVPGTSDIQPFVAEVDSFSVNVVPEPTALAIWTVVGIVVTITHRCRKRDKRAAGAVPNHPPHHPAKNLLRV